MIALDKRVSNRSHRCDVLLRRNLKVLIIKIREARRLFRQRVPAEPHKNRKDALELDHILNNCNVLYVGSFGVGHQEARGLHVFQDVNYAPVNELYVIVFFDRSVIAHPTL